MATATASPGDEARAQKRRERRIAAKYRHDFAWRLLAEAIWGIGGWLAMIVLAMQGDPHFKAYAAGKPPPGFVDFLDRLRAHVLATERPVILIHGDSHMHKIDHPLKDMQGQAIERFTRIETYGAPFMGWVEVRLSNDATVHIRSHPWAPPPNAP